MKLDSNAKMFILVILFIISYFYYINSFEGFATDSEQYKLKFKSAISAIAPYVKNANEMDIYEKTIADYDGQIVEKFKFGKTKKIPKLPKTLTSTVKVGSLQIPRIATPVIAEIKNSETGKKLVAQIKDANVKKENVKLFTNKAKKLAKKANKKRKSLKNTNPKLLTEHIDSIKLAIESMKEAQNSVKLFNEATIKAYELIKQLKVEGFEIEEETETNSDMDEVVVNDEGEDEDEGEDDEEEDDDDDEYIQYMVNKYNQIELAIIELLYNTDYVASLSVDEQKKFITDAMLFFNNNNEQEFKQMIDSVLIK